MAEKKDKKTGAVRGPLWELRGSSIHQQGMFARKAIPAGAKIIEYLGERVPKEISNERALAWEASARKKGEGMVYVFDLNDAYDLDGNIPDNPAKYINHSCDENCEAVNEEDRIFIYSLADIGKGEELSFDYGYGLEHFLDHPCHCGAKGCVGYIVAKPERPKLKRLLAARAQRRKKEAQAGAQGTDSRPLPRKKKTDDNGKATTGGKPAKRGKAAKADSN